MRSQNLNDLFFTFESYTATFVTNWDANSFPTNFPPDRHFSGLIGVTHNEQVVFWEQGQLATLGIEEMAESGSKGTLESEFDNAIVNGNAKFILSGNGISSQNDRVELQFTISRDHPQVSLVTMVAPSPDWFVGVHNLALYVQGNWRDNLSVELVYAMPARITAGHLHRTTRMRWHKTLFHCLPHRLGILIFPMAYIVLMVRTSGLIFYSPSLTAQFAK